jgi:hypothetical protein
VRLRSKALNQDVVTYVTRWTDRDPHPNFVKTVEESEKWGRKLKIVVHGNRHHDQYVRDFQGLLVHRTGHSPSPIAKAVSYALEDALKYSPDAIAAGVLDDDAYHSDPPALCQIVARAVDKHKAGACGPISQYLNMTRHKSVLDIFPVYDRYWTTAGCQYYSMRLIRRHKDQWRTLLGSIAHRPDLAMYLLASANGYPCCEFYVPGWHHKVSHGAKTIGQYDKDWYEKRMDETRRDYQGMADSFRKFNLFDKVAERINRIGNMDLKYLADVATANRVRVVYRTLQELGVE